MSSVHLKGNRLTQRLRGQESELGYIAFEESSGTYVVWLKDQDGVVLGSGVYVRGDEYPSLELATDQALHAPCTQVFHLMWLRSIAKEARREDPASPPSSPSTESVVEDSQKTQKSHSFSSDRIFAKVATAALPALTRQILKWLANGNGEDKH